MNAISVPNNAKNARADNIQNQIGHAHMEPNHAHGLQHLPFVQSKHWISSTSLACVIKKTKFWFIYCKNFNWF
jgi:hypothetical protein